jgi:hypothetical protein
MRYVSFFVLAAAFIAASSFTHVARAAGLADRVPEAFRLVYGAEPTAAEKAYWAARATADKKTFEVLRDAMYFQKAQGKRVGAAVTAKSAGSKPASTAGKKATSADKQKMIVETLPLFIKVFGNNPTNAEKAWWRKRISCDEIKTMAALENSMKFHKSKKVRKGSDAICGATIAKASAAAAKASGVTTRKVAGISDHPMGNIVRIGIFKTDGSPIILTANGTFQVREGADKVLGTAGKDDTVEVSWSGGKYHVRGAAGEFDVVNKVRIVPLNQAIVQIKNYSDPSASIPGKNYNRFRGIMEIRKCTGCNELWAINELHTEYYLRGLGETSGEGPAEYVKALGIAARTYVLYHRVVTGGRNVARDYDIGSTADDQIYRGYEYEVITPRMASIFNQVKGIVVTNGEGDVPVSTIYFSDSDGRTRSAKEVYNTERFPHLQHSVEDPHHVSSTCRGHCVGMSAQGAYGFANKDGWSWQRILKYYYKGVTFVKAY